ncbi:hypothetical protein BDB00DRAFT_878344 [Zychaea mexicana]|uniref:uncharacterized protein n=1 Tax=Zychaea mexicana TaxID=64656 RepID=UPI0022FF0C07|nr:uncharacterized protein BDB00DRAFT_878344 [Zychaea mexicana]KAI9484855.1 hypothetical protein BDB00DRAFT_878344 [Zychaea mexicana]
MSRTQTYEKGDSKKSISKDVKPKSKPEADPFEAAAKSMESALNKYRAMNMPELFLDKLTRWTKDFDIGMFFYERENWSKVDFDCVLGFTNPIHSSRCILADQDMAVADFWRKKTRKQIKSESLLSKQSKGPYNILEQKCNIHNLTADEICLKRSNLRPPTNTEVKQESVEGLSKVDDDIAKQKAHARAATALIALDTAKMLITQEGKAIEKLPEYFKDASAVIKWVQDVWQHDRRACQASAQMRFERNMHAIYLFRLKYITQLLFSSGEFESCVGGDDSDRVYRYIRGGHRLIKLVSQHGFAILLLVDNINAFTLGREPDEEVWKCEMDGLMNETLSDAFNLVNAEFFKGEYSWTAIPALEQIGQWLFQENFLNYTPYL